MTTEVERLHAVVSKLSTSRRDLEEKSEELARTRHELSFGALADADATAQKKLAKVNAEAASVALELQNLTSALQVAGGRLALAQRAEEQAGEVERAKQRLNLASELRALGRKLDTNFSGGLAHRLFELGSLLNQAGSVAPSHQQVQVFGLIALQSMLSGTPWSREFSPVPPNQRTTFAKLTDGWARTVENAARAVLGEKEEAA
jgi:hypothetical protein